MYILKKNIVYTRFDNKVRELAAASLLHTLLLNVTVVPKVVSLVCYAHVSSSLPSFKANLELIFVAFKAIIILDVNVEVSFFQGFFQRKEKHGKLARR